jgi:drug/metabolite transporter (DMT)-like permease
VRTLGASWTAYLKLGLTMLLWGVAWPVGGFLAKGLPLLSIAALRYTVVLVVFFALLLWREGSVEIPRSWVGTLAILGFLSVTLYQAFFLFSVHYAAAGDDSLVIGLSPIMVAVLASFIVKESLGWQKVVGLFLGLAGVVLISQLSPNVDVPNRALGMSLVVGGVLVYALYTVYLRKFITTHNGDGGRKPSSLAIITWVSFFGWIFLVPFSLLERPWTYSWPVDAWIGILYLALLSTVVGYLFFVQGVAAIGASRAVVFSNLVPVFGVLSSAVILGELLSIWHAVSFALIFGGVYLVNRRH